MAHHLTKKIFSCDGAFETARPKAGRPDVSLPAAIVVGVVVVVVVNRPQTLLPNSPPYGWLPRLFISFPSIDLFLGRARLLAGAAKWIYLRVVVIVIVEGPPPHPPQASIG